MVNDKTIMMIGGYIDEDSGFSERTFSIDFDDLESGTWTDGPSMKNYRGYLGCGSFNSDFHGGVVTMAFGTWTDGPSMKNYRGYLGCGSFNSEFHGGVVTMAFGTWTDGPSMKNYRGYLGCG